MEAEISALAHNCRELFAVIDMTKSLGKAVGITIGETTMNLSIHEYNAGYLILEKILPPHFTPQSKHYSANTI